MGNQRLHVSPKRVLQIVCRGCFENGKNDKFEEEEVSFECLLNAVSEIAKQNRFFARMIKQYKTAGASQCLDSTATRHP
jgi:predicted metal-binding protein